MMPRSKHIIRGGKARDDDSASSIKEVSEHITSFVELDRCFVPTSKDQEPSLDVGRIWGRKISGWLNWSDLYKYRRIVLLAEASSGKTAEFRNQVDRLSADGKFAFFTRIEELADQGIIATLEPPAAKLFQKWRSTGGKAFFFLDSVDEARLNRKNFETALKRFAADLEDGIERAHVFISCRVTDWKGSEDRSHIGRLLPAPEAAQNIESDEDVNPLLDPIFKKKEHQVSEDNKTKQQLNELLVVHLVPLDTEQCKMLARAFAVADPDTFVKAIQQNGLDAYSERPGDLLDLADYWNSHRCFGTFAEMVEHSINRKLSEKDPFRPDNDTLSQQKARQGAERLAAALTLGKSFTLRAPGYDPDPSLAVGAIDPADVLNDWTAAERNALLRRGVFAPSTYGRVRFHHRSTQEYLGASWFNRLLHTNCPQVEVWDRFFAERYGVETVVPSLRPVAAWLSLWQPDFRDEVIRREPLVLLRHGDPGSVPLDAKKRLLATFATKQASADIADDSLDHRALWMFADQSLAEAVRAAWTANTKLDFRMDLLRLVREGAIIACVDLAKGVVFDESARGYYRVVAAQALAACKDESCLATLAAQLAKTPEQFDAYLAAHFAVSLFPRHLSIPQLISVIEKSQPPEKGTVEGFAYNIVEFYRLCPDKVARSDLAARLAELCLKPPFSQAFERVSRQFSDLAKHLEPIAIEEALESDADDAPEHLIRLLMVVERAGRRSGIDEQKVSLSQIVQSRTKLRRALFWADAAEARANAKDDEKPIRFWQVFFYGETLWKLGPADLPWLYEDLNVRCVDDRRIALSAIFQFLQQEGRLESEVEQLRHNIDNELILVQDLEAYLAPPVESEEMRKHRQWSDEHARKREERQVHDKKSWEDFRGDVLANTAKLRDPNCLKDWKSGTYRLGGLTLWLHHRVQNDEIHAMRQWRLLEEGFGSRELAEAYRDGMKLLWRFICPERPKRKDGGAITIKRMNILAFGAVGLEAVEDPEWALKLSEADAKRAILHACLSEQGYPDWIDDLIKAHPKVVLPIIKRNFKSEWLGADKTRSDLLYRYARPIAAIQPTLQKLLFEVLTGPIEPTDLSKVERGIRIIKNLTLDQTQARKIEKLARDRLKQHTATKQTELALHYLALLFILAPDTAVDELETWLLVSNQAECSTRAEVAFSFLFDRHDPLISNLRQRASVATLERLLRLVYHHVRPEHDAVHKGAFSPNTRDNAEGARNMILGALIESPGADAYFALRRVASDPNYALRADRFRELARGMAERDTEPPSWTAKEVVAFEREYTAPVKTGGELLKIVMNVLEDIQHALDHNDVSSRPLLQNARNEGEVRDWLMEQIDFRSKGRITAYREAEVADENMPDVIVSSTSAQCEVAIEVKHGGKSWTLRDYETALRQQLGNDYLKPATRRHGVLVISFHGARQWRDPETNEIVTFDKLLKRLSGIAEALTTNSFGSAILVRCFGIDASDKPNPRKRK